MFVTSALVGTASPAAGEESVAPIGPGYSDNHEGVTCVQRALDVNLGEAAPGTYGDVTYRAVVAFQQEEGITPTGAVGPLTGDALIAAGRTAPGCSEVLPTSSNSSREPAGRDEIPSTPAESGDPEVSARCEEGSRESSAWIARWTAVVDAATMRTNDGDPATVTLRFSPQARCAWGWIGGEQGARVWVERRSSSLPNDTAPSEGTSSIRPGNENTYSAPLAVSQGDPVRACGQVRQAPTCTAWFDGTITSGSDDEPVTPAPAPAPATLPVCEEGSRESAETIAERTPVETAATILTGDSATVTLRFSPDTRCAWGWIGGEEGAVVWVERRSSSRPNDTAPSEGTSSIRPGNENTYSAPMLVGEDDPVRACGQLRQAPTCTAWFNGTTTPAGDDGQMTYVALGDSFSSGEGAGDFLPGTDYADNLCHRSGNAYAEVVGTALDTDPVFVACSGAVTADYWSPQESRDGQRPQQEALTPATDLVTLTMGGNDIGFATVADNCAVRKQLRQSLDADCYDVLGAASTDVEGFASGDRARSFEAMLTDIHDRAPNARILVLGYPRMFPDAPGRQCATGFPGISFLQGEMQQMNGLVDQLNAAIQAKVGSVAGAEYVDVSAALADRGLCSEDGVREVNRLRGVAPASLRNQSFHPNATGQATLAQYVLCHLGRCE